MTARISRRQMIGAAAALVGGASAAAEPRDAAAFGLVPDARENQGARLQQALDAAARDGRALALAPGRYRVGRLRLPANARLVGAGAATRLELDGPGPLMAAQGADGLLVAELSLDGRGQPMANGQGLLTVAGGRRVRIENCEIANSSANGIHFEAVEGAISGCRIVQSRHAAIFSRDGGGLRIVDNVVEDSGNNGILVWRSAPGHDGTAVLGNRIENIAAQRGGSGQYGNGINVFRAGAVMVANNRIRGCAFSAVRGHSASNIQIIGNNCAALGEVALYVEFAFEGALVAQNVVDGASFGISVTNFNEGGRLAVVQGNLLRNVVAKPPPGTNPESWGVGIHVEADAAVSANVIENAARKGLSLGWGRHLRDVNAHGNVIRDAAVGIAVSVAPGAGTAVIRDNLISGATVGAIVGFDHGQPVTGDLTTQSLARFPQLAIAGNVVR